MWLKGALKQYEAHERLKQACDIFEKNSADATALWEVLNEIAETAVEDCGKHRVDSALIKKAVALVEKPIK